MIMVSCMPACILQRVREAVGYQIQSHEKKDNTHSETGKDFASLQSKRVSQTAPRPDFEVPTYIDGNAEEGP